MVKRIASLFTGIVLGAALCAALVANSEPEEPKLNPFLNIDRALDVTIPTAPGTEVLSEYYKIQHECCDCGLTHDVIMFEVPEKGLRMLWWRDEKRTRKNRKNNLHKSNYNPILEVEANDR